MWGKENGGSEVSDRGSMAVVVVRSHLLLGGLVASNQKHQSLGGAG
jgi:hypothetical protein